MSHLFEGTPIVGIILCIGTITALLEVTKRRRLQKKAILLDLLSAAAERNELTVSKSDIFGDHILGYDEVRQALFFFYARQNDILIFNLDDIADCALQKSIQGSNVNNIDLCLKGPFNGPVYLLPLYSRFQDNGWRGRIIIRRAEKWKTLIEGIIIEKKLSAVRSGR